MRLRTCLLTLAAMTLAACADKSYHVVADRPASLPEVTAGEVGVLVDRPLANACDLPSQQVFFHTDEARLSEGDRLTLDLVASCVIEGPLAGEQLVVQGYADPRAAEIANERLARRRAEAVVSYLVDRGVSREQLEAKSLGEEGAVDGAPETWPADRRVDIVWVK